MRCLLACVLAATFAAATPARATECTMIGNVLRCSDGLSGTQIGNVWYFSDGRRGTMVGDVFELRGPADAGRGSAPMDRDGASCGRIGPMEFCARQARPRI